MSEFFLFLDLETTGLDPRETTVLECGWTVTDDKLVQRTPLRSRFTALSTGGASVTPVNHGGRWSDVGRVEQVVRDMHAGSGLHREWLGAPELSVIRRTADLERLLVDDLLTAGWTGGKDDTVHLAGGGVSHFDRPVLDALPVLQLSGDKGSLLHYRAADSSSASTLLGIPSPKKPSDLQALADGFLDHLGVASLVTDATTDHLAGQNGLNFDGMRQHRAADDVAYSLVYARCLRAMVS